MEVFTTTIPAGWSYTDEEHEVLEAMEKAWRATLPDHTFLQWLDIFPQAKNAAKRGLRTRIKQEKENLSSLSEYRETLYNGYVNTAKFKEQPARIEWLDAHIQGWVDTYETEMKRLMFELQCVENIGKEPTVSKNGYTAEELERAKSVPINSLITVSRGKKALCVWHDDRHPSMQVYATRVWCFSCQQGGDTIDLYMKLNKCDMVTAVRALTT